MYNMYVLAQHLNTVHTHTHTHMHAHLLYNVIQYLPSQHTPLTLVVPTVTAQTAKLSSKRR